MTCACVCVCCPGKVLQLANCIVCCFFCFYRPQDGTQVHFKVKRTTPFQKVFNAYATRQNLNSESLKFLFDGRRLKAHETPADYDMEDGDSIDCMLEQLGGGGQR